MAMLAVRSGTSRVAILTAVSRRLLFRRIPIGTPNALWLLMRIPLLLLASLLVACGGRAEGSGSPTGGATSTPEAPPSAMEPASPPRLSGNISLIRAGDRLAVSALFPLAGAPTAVPLGPDCISRPATSSGPLDSASAGEIIVDAPSGDLSLRLCYDATKRAYDDATFEGAVPAGSPITVHASGTVDVPAFDVTGEAAEAAKLAEPPQGASIARDSNDLAVTWTPMQEPLLVASLQIGDTTISCRFDAPTGHGVVPGALIRTAVKAVAKDTSSVSPWVSLSLFTGHTTTVTSGSYDVFVTHGAFVAHGLMLAK